MLFGGFELCELHTGKQETDAEAANLHRHLNVEVHPLPIGSPVKIKSINHLCVDEQEHELRVGLNLEEYVSPNSCWERGWYQHELQEPHRENGAIVGNSKRCEMLQLDLKRRQCFVVHAGAIA